MDAQPFDEVKAWQKLRARLDTFTVEDVCRRLGITTKRQGAAIGPIICPRWVCRSTRTFPTSGGGWFCPVCGAMGGAAALLAAHTAGWLTDHSPAVPADFEIPTVPPGGHNDFTDEIMRERDDEIRKDFSRLAREALDAGLIDTDDPEWFETYNSIPGFSDWGTTERGVYEGDDRKRAIAALAMKCARSGWSGKETARVLQSHNICVCRPPLSANEIAEVLTKAAGVKP